MAITESQYRLFLFPFLFPVVTTRDIRFAYGNHHRFLWGLTRELSKANDNQKLELMLVAPVMQARAAFV